MKKYRFLFFTLLLGFFFIPKGANAQVTNIRYYDTNFNLLANTTNTYYGEYIDNVRYIRVLFDDTLQPNTSYITSFDFESTSPTDYLWIYWYGNSGVNIGGSYRATSPTSAKTISQGLGDNLEYFKRSFLTFDFQNTTGSSSNFFQLDLGSPQIVSYFRMNNYTISATSDANTDAIINGFNNLESSIAQNNQALIDNQNKNQQQTNEKLDEAEKTRKGIWNTIKDLPNMLKNMFLSLFVPDDNYFEDKFDELLGNVEDVLGFLAYPFTLITRTFEFFLTIEDTGNYVISWEDVKVPNFEEYSIIKAGSFDFATLLDDSRVASLRNIAFVFINALLLLAFLQLCHNKYNQVFGGDVSTTEFISVAEEYDIDYNTGEVSNIKHIEKKTTRRDIK